MRYLTMMLLAGGCAPDVVDVVEPEVPEPVPPAELAVRLDPKLDWEGAIAYVHDARGQTLDQAPLDVTGGAVVQAPPAGGGVTVAVRLDVYSSILLTVLGLDVGDRFELMPPSYYEGSSVEVRFDDTVVPEADRYQVSTACGTDVTSDSPATVWMPTSSCTADVTTVTIVAEDDAGRPIAYATQADVPVREDEPLDATTAVWQTDFAQLDLVVAAPDTPATVWVEGAVVGGSEVLQYFDASADMAPGGSLAAALPVVAGDGLVFWVGAFERERHRLSTTTRAAAPTDGSLRQTLDLTEALLPRIATLETTSAPTGAVATLEGPARCSIAGEAGVALWRFRGEPAPDRSVEWRLVTPASPLAVTVPDLGADGDIWWPEEDLEDVYPELTLAADAGARPEEMALSALLFEYELEGMVPGGGERCFTSTQAP